MVYEVIYYKNLKNEWMWLRVEDVTSDMVARRTEQIITKLGVKGYYIYVSFLNEWINQPEFATNPTCISPQSVPKEVLALNLLNSVE